MPEDPEVGPLWAEVSKVAKSKLSDEEKSEKIKELLKKVK